MDRCNSIEFERLDVHSKIPSSCANKRRLGLMESQHSADTTAMRTHTHTHKQTHTHTPPHTQKQLEGSTSLIAAQLKLGSPMTLVLMVHN